MRQIARICARFFVPGFLAALSVGAVAGCSNNQAVESPSYQKLPPGEGARRLQDTLRRRAQARARATPLPPNVRVDQQPP